MSDLQTEPLEGLPGDAPGLRVRFDAPTRRNALTEQTVDELHQVLLANPDALLLLGSTTPDIFSAGADLAADDLSRARLSDQLYACYELMVTRPAPVIAVVEGAAVGGGAQLSAAADLRIASPNARWRWVGPGHGLAVGSWILPHLLGRSRALDLTLTGRWLGLEEAHAAGFIARTAVEPWAEALQVAEILAQGDPAAISRVKQVATHPELLEALAEERRRNREVWTGRAPTPREAAQQGRTSDGAAHDSKTTPDP
jgi:enoyl-CoA hydratase/carnithine racemase